jgi:hypothetical protein
MGSHLHSFPLLCSDLFYLVFSCSTRLDLRGFFSYSDLASLRGYSSRDLSRLAHRSPKGSRKGWTWLPIKIGGGDLRGPSLSSLTPISPLSAAAPVSLSLSAYSPRLLLLLRLSSTLLDLRGFFSYSDLSSLRGCSVLSACSGRFSWFPCSTPLLFSLSSAEGSPRGPEGRSFFLFSYSFTCLLVSLDRTIRSAIYDRLHSFSPLLWRRRVVCLRLCGDARGQG